MRRMWCKIFVFAICSQTGSGQLFLGIRDDLIDAIIPTIKSNNDLCKNHSIFYKNELKKLTIWATES